MPRNIGNDLGTERKKTLEYIDSLAGDTRSRFVSPGDLIDAEYEQVKQAVIDWRAAGSPADQIPDEILSGAEYLDTDDYEIVASDIEQTALTFKKGLQSVRRGRLCAKRKALSASSVAELRKAEKMAKDSMKEIEKELHDLNNAGRSLSNDEQQ